MHIPVMIGKKTYFIESNANEYSIGEMGETKEGMVYQPRWHYQSLAALCTALLHKKVRASDAQSLSELKEVILSAESEIMSELDFNKRGVIMVERRREGNALR